MVGSAALHLQCSYQSRTKDGDILELCNITSLIRNKLESIAGRESLIQKKHRMYLDFVKRALLFMPAQAKFNTSISVNSHLVNFKLEALDVTDVVISKLAPFRSKDVDDIKAMIDLELIDPKVLLERFLLAKEQFLLGSRSNHLENIIENLHRVQRDFLHVSESIIELPDWIGH